MQHRHQLEEGKERLAQVVLFSIADIQGTKEGVLPSPSIKLIILQVKFSSLLMPHLFSNSCPSILHQHKYPFLPFPHAEASTKIPPVTMWELPAQSLVSWDWERGVSGI